MTVKSQHDAPPPAAAAEWRDRAARERDRTFPLVEVFGPTVQGEGPEAGVPVHFIRLGGCDYRCSWCDSMHAVEPAQVRQAERATAEQIVDRVAALTGDPAWVVISGGNPALHQLGYLLRLLHERGMNASVETQGSVWRPWLVNLDRLVISPKPPSSGMATARHAHLFAEFMEHVLHSPRLRQRAALKVVAFDDADYEWARDVHTRYDLPFFLSAGTDQTAVETQQRAEVLSYDETIQLAIGRRYGHLCDRVARDPAMRHVKVLPQLHVIAWGTRQGV